MKIGSSGFPMIRNTFGLPRRNFRRAASVLVLAVGIPDGFPLFGISPSETPTVRT